MKTNAEPILAYGKHTLGIVRNVVVKVHISTYSTGREVTFKTVQPKLNIDDQEEQQKQRGLLKLVKPINAKGVVQETSEYYQKHFNRPRLVVTRKQAMERNAPRYFTGKPCSRGHIADRNTNDGNCVKCKAVQGLRYRFGISEEDYTKILSDQGGVCKICSKKCSMKRRLAVDHCHTTGEIRGLLCGSCNKGIGHLRDDPNILRKAADYLENSRRNITPIAA